MAQVKDLWSILRSKYPENEYALMEEVSDAAGYYRSNSADYIAVCLWPSRGLAVNGIELKSFRSDWLRELKKPDKAENIFKNCDYFWLLTTDDTIAKIEEIPATWGWMCVKGSKIIIKKQAPKLEPQTLSKGFVISMLKRACNRDKYVHIDTIQDKIEQAKEQALRYKEIENKRRMDRANELIDIVSEFEKSSGIKFGSWGGYKPEKVGKAVKFINDGGVDGIKKDLERLLTASENIFKRISSVLTELNEIKHV